MIRVTKRQKDRNSKRQGPEREFDIVMSLLQCFFIQNKADSKSVLSQSDEIGEVYMEQHVDPSA